MNLKRILPYAPLMALGPVTGPLVGLMLAEARASHWARACGIALAIVGFNIALASVGMASLAHLAGMVRL